MNRIKVARRDLELYTNLFKPPAAKLLYMIYELRSGMRSCASFPSKQQTQDNMTCGRTCLTAFGYSRHRPYSSGLKAIPSSGLQLGWWPQNRYCWE